MTNTNVVYIMGSGHSGSTLLDLLLGSHAGVTSLGEMTRFDDYVLANGTCTCLQPVRECAFWNKVRRVIKRGRQVDIFAEPQSFPTSLTLRRGRSIPRLVKAQRFALAVLGRPQLARHELAPPGLTPAWAITENTFALFEAVQAVTGCHTVVDSSKWHTRMKWLWMARPEHVKVIYLVRDGRGVMASYLRKGRTPEQAIRGWVTTQALTRLVLRSMPHSAWLFARYEDLCSDPAGELARICDFLSLDFAEDMLHFRKVVHHNINGNHMRFAATSDIVNAEAWRHKLTAADLRLFEQIGGPLNRRLGYPPTDPSLLSG